MKQFFRKNIYLIAVILLSIGTLVNFWDSESSSNNQSYTTFVNDIEQGNLQQVTIVQNGSIKVIRNNGETYNTILPLRDDKLLDQLLAKKVDVVGKLPEGPSFLVSLLSNILPLIIFFGAYIWIVRRMSGGAGGAMGANKPIGRVYEASEIKTRLKDVAGCDEAKQEVAEVVDFLRDPHKFTRVGAHIPKGLLMVGPPGTGKTLMARAIAGEAGVPFITASGSEFVEMFVGVGAQRVRQLFQQAKKRGRALIFIDEIDAVGRKRGNNAGGGHMEHEQTLNQLLVEMDGFDEDTNVIVIAATNRADVLDDALVRPGRFDRQVNIDLPDLQGRHQILKVHAQRFNLAKDVNLKTIARGTPGFSGADLANLLNEAALMSARNGLKQVTMKYFELAQDKITLGTERGSLTMTQSDKIRTAYHEAGHAIVGYLVEGNDPVHKVTIIPRGRALGVTYFLPNEDQIYYSKSIYEAKLQMIYAGRLAEEIKFGAEAVSTGASSDIQVASRYSRAMVTKYGFSKNLGPIDYGADANDPYGRPQASAKYAEMIDQEVYEIIQTNYERSRQVLLANLDILESMKDALLEYETIDKWQVERLMNREPVGKPRDWDDDSDERNFEHLKEDQA